MGKNRHKIQNRLADEWCTRSILDPLCTTEVGRRTGPRGASPKPNKNVGRASGAQEMSRRRQRSFSWFCSP